MPGLKKALWGSAFWSSGFFVHSVGRHGSETVIRRYVKQQGIKDYQQIHSGQRDLFDHVNQAGEDTP
jgi:putative transposase